MDRREFLKRGSLWLGGVGGLGLLGGCQTTDLGAGLSRMGQTFGGIGGIGGGDSRVDSLLRVGGAVARAMEDLDAEQEYYLGRTVAANLLTEYKTWDHRAANDYLNLVGRYLSSASALPETFGGYHFQILDSDEINAFAAPGGLILVTRGLLRCCKSEDAVAAVLAHEVGHVQHRHGIRAIRRSRLTSAASIIGVEAARHAGSPELGQLVNHFEGSINDIIVTMVNNGYSRDFERESDQVAVGILQRTGYDDRALVAMLEEMGDRLRPDAKDFAATHPTPAERIATIEPNLVSTAERPVSRARQTRFLRAMSSV